MPLSVIRGDDALDDTLDGTEENDLLLGLGGNDTLDGKGGRDTLIGGDGNDIFVISSADGDVIKDFRTTTGEADKIRIEAGVLPSGSSIIYSAVDDDGHTYLFATDKGGDHLATLEGYTGTLDATMFDGGSAITAITPITGVIIGTAGDDTLVDSNDTDDIFLGLGGDDVIVAYSGADIIDGGDGIDTANYNNSPFGVTINLSAVQPDGYVHGSGSDSWAAGDRLKNIENVTGSIYDDILTGDDGANTLDGGVGADTFIIGSADGDVITDFWVEQEEIHLTGELAHLTEVFLVTSSEYSYLFTDDSYSKIIAVLEGERALSNANVKQAADTSITITVTEVEMILGTDGDDDLTGTAGNDTIHGLDGDDVLSGGGSSTDFGNTDTLIGGAGKDTLYGEGGNDHFYLLNPITNEGDFHLGTIANFIDSITDYNSYGGSGNDDRIVLPDELDTLFIVGSGTTNLYLVSPTSDGMAVYGRIADSNINAANLASNTQRFFKESDLSRHTGLTLVNVQEGAFKVASTDNKEELSGTSGVDYFIMTADPEDWYANADRVTYTEGDQIYITGLAEAGLDDTEIIVARFITVDPQNSNTSERNKHAGDLIVLDSTGTQVLFFIDLPEELEIHGNPASPSDASQFTSKVNDIIGNEDLTIITQDSGGRYYEFLEHYI